MAENEMLDYLLATGLYEEGSEKHPYLDLLYEQNMINSDKAVLVKDLVSRFIEVDKEYNGEPWNIKQILTNIRMVS